MKRSQLYALIWAEPMRRVAPRLGLSDVGLSKLCRRNNIPVPPRGYWAKVRAGKKPATIQLSKTAQDAEIAELRVFDATGMRLSANFAPEVWIIPGVLKQVFPDFMSPESPDNWPAL